MSLSARRRGGGPGTERCRIEREEIARAIEAIQSVLHGADRSVLDATLTLAVEIAREGQEGRRTGALFTIGCPSAVLAGSRSLILDPLAGHAPQSTHIGDQSLRGTLRALAQLDGAFVLSDEGIVLSASRYLDVSSRDVAVPLGLGSRHVAAAAISKRLDVVAIAVSASGVVRVFCRGVIVATLHARD